jgi:hypothetical protein
MKEAENTLNIAIIGLIIAAFCSAFIFWIAGFIF